jgi:hypothetical protein
VHQTKDGRGFTHLLESGKQHRKVFGRGDIAHQHALRFDQDKKREKGRAVDLGVGLSVAELWQRYHSGHPVKRSTGIN